MKKRNVVEVEITENELKKIVKDHMENKGISCKEDDVIFACTIPTYGFSEVPKKGFLKCTLRGTEDCEKVPDAPLYCACSDIVTGNMER